MPMHDNTSRRSRAEHLSQDEINIILHDWINYRPINDTAKKLMCSKRIVVKHRSYFKAEGIERKAR